jgi:hypothetical protein
LASRGRLGLVQMISAPILATRRPRRRDEESHPVTNGAALIYHYAPEWIRTTDLMLRRAPRGFGWIQCARSFNDLRCWDFLRDTAGFGGVWHRIWHRVLPPAARWSEAEQHVACSHGGWQEHRKRNVLYALPKTKRASVKLALNEAYGSAKYERAKCLLENLARRLAPGASRRCGLPAQGLDDTHREASRSERRPGAVAVHNESDRT